MDRRFGVEVVDRDEGGTVPDDAAGRERGRVLDVGEEAVAAVVRVARVRGGFGVG